MHKILLFLLAGFALSVVSVFAAPAPCPTTGVMTSTGFMVGLDCMDPLAGNHAQGTIPSGKAALSLLLGTVSKALLLMIPIIAVISLLIAGYFYIFSAGDSEKTGRAKTIIKWNIIAMLVAFFSFAIVNFIALILT